MKQNINLYRQATTSAEAPPAAWQVALGLGLLTGSLLVVQLMLDNRTAQARQATIDLRARVETAQTQLSELTAATPATDAGLEARLESLLAQLDLSEHILGLVSGGGAGDVGGFSPQIRSLARQRADGVWLTRVQVRAPQARTTLEGRAMHPDFVPAYLRKLSTEPALAGQRFDVFAIEGGQKRGEPVSFALNRTVTAPEGSQR